MPSPAALPWGARIQPLARWWRARSPVARDVLPAAALAVAAFLPVLSTVGAEIGDLPVHPPDAATVVLVLAQCLPLVVRRRWPGACLAVVGAGFVAHEVTGQPPTFAGVGLYIALYSAGAYQTGFRVASAVAATAVYGGLAVALHTLGSPQQAPDFIAFFLVLALAWAAGAGMRRWRAQEEQRRRLIADRAAASERTRIARELHDVVTHHVTAMVVQSDATQYLIHDHAGRAVDGLAAISDTGRRALTELRSLLDVLEATGDSGDSGDRPDTAAARALGRLRDLVEHARRAGQPVEYTEAGAVGPVPVDVELAAYRMVQESLTNAMKHAFGRRTVVHVDHGAQVIEIDVSTDGPTVPPGDRGAGGRDTGGRGLAGLGDRLGALGGSLDAGARADGGFRVHALIPHGGRA